MTTIKEICNRYVGGELSKEEATRLLNSMPSPAKTEVLARLADTSLSVGEAYRRLTALREEANLDFLAMLGSGDLPWEAFALVELASNGPTRHEILMWVADRTLSAANAKTFLDLLEEDEEDHDDEDLNLDSGFDDDDDDDDDDDYDDDDDDDDDADDLDDDEDWDWGGPYNVRETPAPAGCALMILVLGGACLGLVAVSG